MGSPDCLLGIDAGGTHTDAVVCSEGRLAARAKVPTDHGDLPACIGAVLEALVRDGGPDLLHRVTRVTLGTTLLVNAAIQGRLDPVGLALSAGPGLSPLRFALGDHVCVLPGGLDHRGVEVTPLDTRDFRRTLAGWREEGIRAVACVGKFSPRNPAHEQAMGRTAAEVIPDLRLTLGHRLSGGLNFPRRIASAWYNSAAQRLHADFLDAVSTVLERMGSRAPVFLLKADGGALPLAVSRPLPVHSLLSGPAASVMGVLALQPGLEERCTLLMDIGGTTTDLALFVSGSPVLDRDGMRLGGRRTLVRALATRSIGVGGDSRLSVTEKDGRPSVRTGPVRPGPAMAFGGAEPTLLDALNLLNLADGLDQTAGDVTASRAGLESLAARAGCSPEDLALLAWQDALSQIDTARRQLTAEINARPVYTLRELKGHIDVQPERVSLVGGPTHCLRGRLAGALGLPVMAVPEADVANAAGAALTRPSARLDVYADSGRATLLAPSLDIREKLPRQAGLDYVRERALALLRDDLAAQGVTDCPLEVTEADLFATLADSGFGSRDMRVACQVVPGILGRIGA